jgi:hypothetical protein
MVINTTNELQTKLTLKKSVLTLSCKMAKEDECSFGDALNRIRNIIEIAILEIRGELRVNDIGNIQAKISFEEDKDE